MPEPGNAPDPPFILYTLGSMKIGGAEIRSLELLAALKRDYPRLNVIVYFTCPEGGPLEPDFMALGLTIVRGPRGLAGMAHLWWLCARSRIEILHTNADTVSGFYCFAAALAGVGRRIAHYRITAAPSRSLYQRVILHSGRVLLRLFATDVIGVCEGARLLAGVRKERWSTIYNGITCPAAAAAAPAWPPRLLFLGRIHPDKNFEKAIAIFEAVHARSGKAAELHFVGAGSPDQIAKLNERASASSAFASIVIHGPSRHPDEHLRSASVLLLPSVREGLPGCALEALCHSVPVVASDLPGLREIRDRSRGVYLVDSRASLDSWADAVEDAIGETREEIGRRFRDGPFHFEEHKGAIERLWTLAGNGRRDAA